MLIEDLLWLILSAVVARVVWRTVDGVMEGMRGPKPPARNGAGPPAAPARGVQMVRDPVCGTFVVPDGAVSIGDGSRQVYFCSETCRDKYRARTA